MKMGSGYLPRPKDEEESRKAFSSAVQSVAFSLTLSRRMVSMLRVIRDESLDRARSFSAHVEAGITRDGSWHIIPLLRSLERRGLIYYSGPAGSPSCLSDAGKAVCELLVLADMISPPASPSTVAPKTRRKQARA